MQEEVFSIRRECVQYLDNLYILLSSSSFLENYDDDLEKYIKNNFKLRRKEIISKLKTSETVFKNINEEYLNSLLLKYTEIQDTKLESTKLIEELESILSRFESELNIDVNTNKNSDEKSTKKRKRKGNENDIKNEGSQEEKKQKSEKEKPNSTNSSGSIFVVETSLLPTSISSKNNDSERNSVVGDMSKDALPPLVDSSKIFTYENITGLYFSWKDYIENIELFELDSNLSDNFIQLINYWQSYSPLEMEHLQNHRMWMIIKKIIPKLDKVIKVDIFRTSLLEKLAKYSTGTIEACNNAPMKTTQLSLTSGDKSNLLDPKVRKPILENLIKFTDDYGANIELNTDEIQDMILVITDWKQLFGNYNFKSKPESEFDMASKIYDRVISKGNSSVIIELLTQKIMPQNKNSYETQQHKPQNTLETKSNNAGEERNWLHTTLTDFKPYITEYKFSKDPKKIQDFISLMKQWDYFYNKYYQSTDLDILFALIKSVPGFNPETIINELYDIYNQLKDVKEKSDYFDDSTSMQLFGGDFHNETKNTESKKPENQKEILWPTSDDLQVFLKLLKAKHESLKSLNNFIGELNSENTILKLIDLSKSWPDKSIIFLKSQDLLDVTLNISSIISEELLKHIPLILQKRLECLRDLKKSPEKENTPLSSSRNPNSYWNSGNAANQQPPDSLTLPASQQHTSESSIVSSTIYPKSPGSS